MTLDIATPHDIDQESSVVGVPCADAAPHRFPANVRASSIVTAADLLALANAQPKGSVAASLPAKHWLPVNEQLAVQLGHAQAALRLLDDQRALVKSCEVHADIIVIDLHRAPSAGKAIWQHVDTAGGRAIVTADLVDANDSVLLRWPLEKAA